MFFHGLISPSKYGKFVVALTKEDISLKKLAILLLISLALTGCSSQEDATLSKFKKEMNEFCDNIVEIDTAINQITNISADEDGLKTATEDLMLNLDMLDDEFVKFSNIDFPEEYDYLEEVADEASEYMTEAVKAYHIAFEDNYTESMEEYAQENYSRAYKRVQIILDVLHGEETESN